MMALWTLKLLSPQMISMSLQLPVASRRAKVVDSVSISVATVGAITETTEKIVNEERWMMTEV